MTERLDKFLVSQGIGSRKEVTRLVRRGAVMVDGKPTSTADCKIDPENSKVTVEGKEIVYRRFLYIMMNKPAGVLSATEDRKSRTVLDLLPPPLSRRGLFPAGRLDKDTTGLLILTDDGEFAHRMLSPKSHVYKRYAASTQNPVTAAAVSYTHLTLPMWKPLKTESGREISRLRLHACGRKNTRAGRWRLWRSERENIIR